MSSEAAIDAEANACPFGKTPWSLSRVRVQKGAEGVGVKRQCIHDADGVAELPHTSQSSSGQKYSLTPQVSTMELQWVLVHVGKGANKGITTSREMPRALVEREMA